MSVLALIAMQYGQLEYPVLLLYWECALSRTLNPFTLLVETDIKNLDLSEAQNLAIKQES